MNGENSVKLDMIATSQHYVIERHASLNCWLADKPRLLLFCFSVLFHMYEALKQTQNKMFWACFAFVLDLFWNCFALFCFSCKSCLRYKTIPCHVCWQSMFEDRKSVQNAFCSFICRFFAYINFVLSTCKFNIRSIFRNSTAVCMHGPAWLQHKKLRSKVMVP